MYRARDEFISVCEAVYQSIGGACSFPLTANFDGKLDTPQWLVKS
jgi:hypothetical protein